VATILHNTGLLLLVGLFSVIFHDFPWSVHTLYTECSQSSNKQDLENNKESVEWVRLIDGSDRDLLDDGLHESGSDERRVRLPDDILCSVEVVTGAADEQETLLAVPNDRLQHLTDELVSKLFST